MTSRYMKMTCSSQAVSTNMTWCPCQSCVAHLSTSSWWRSSRTRRMSRHRPGAGAPASSGSTPTAASGRWSQRRRPRFADVVGRLLQATAKTCGEKSCFPMQLSLLVRGEAVLWKSRTLDTGSRAEPQCRPPTFRYVRPMLNAPETQTVGKYLYTSFRVEIVDMVLSSL